MRDDLGIIDRELAVNKLAAKRDLHAIEAELLSERDRLRIGSQMKIPIRDADAQLASCRQDCTAGKWSGGQTAEETAASQARHWGHCSPLRRSTRIPAFPWLSDRPCSLHGTFCLFHRSARRLWPDGRP